MSIPEDNKQEIKKAQLNSVYNEVRAGFADSSKPMVDVLRRYKDLLSLLGELPPKYLEEELSGYDADEDVPEYRLFNLDLVEVRSDSKQFCGAIQTERKNVPWDSQVIGRYLRKVPGFIVNNRLACREPIAFYSGTNFSSNVLLCGKIPTILGDDGVSEWNNIEVSARNQSVNKMLSKVRDVYYEHFVTIEKKYNLDIHIIMNNNPVTINLNGNNNNVVAAGNNNTISENQNHDAYKSEVIRKESCKNDNWWVILVIIIILALSAILLWHGGAVCFDWKKGFLKVETPITNHTPDTRGNISSPINNQANVVK